MSYVYLQSNQLFVIFWSKVHHIFLVSWMQASPQARGYQDFTLHDIISSLPCSTDITLYGWSSSFDFHPDGDRDMSHIMTLLSMTLQWHIFCTLSLFSLRFWDQFHLENLIYLLIYPFEAIHNIVWPIPFFTICYFRSHLVLVCSCFLCLLLSLLHPFHYVQ